MKNLIVLAVFTILSFFSTSLFGQTANSTPNPQQEAESRRQAEAEMRAQERQRQVNAEGVRRLDQLRNMPEAGNIRTRIDNGPRSVVSLSPADLTKEQKILLKPHAEDLNHYAEFLRQPETGLIKLFPDAGCEENFRVLRVDDECLRWIPNSGFYSFRRKRYVSGSFSDIRYKSGLLITDGFLAQGIMTTLGDIPLDKISLTSEGMRFLNDYKPASLNTDAAEQMKKIVSGIMVGNQLYRNFWRVLENTTYALRSIAYRGNVQRSSRGFVYNVLDSDKRKDIIVIFRVVRKSSDGSITILWRELAQKDSPKITYPKTKNK